MIVILGGSGFIGQHLVKKCIQKGLEVLLILREGGNLKYCNEDKVRCVYTESFADALSILKDVKVVINLIGISNVAECRTSPNAAFNVNGFFLLKVLNYLKSNPKTRFIHVSTSEVYGKINYLPIDEQHPINPDTIYGQSKYLGEQIVDLYRDIFKLNVVVIRLFNVFGQGQSETSIISEIINSIKNGKNITIRDGEIARDFVYIKDVLSAIFRSIECKKDIGTINICSGREIKLIDLACIIRKKYNSKALIINQKKITSHARVIVGSANRARKKIGWYPSYDIDKAITNMIEHEK